MSRGSLDFVFDVYGILSASGCSSGSVQLGVVRAGRENDLSKFDMRGSCSHAYSLRFIRLYVVGTQRNRRYIRSGCADPGHMSGGARFSRKPFPCPACGSCFAVVLQSISPPQYKSIDSKRLAQRLCHLTSAQLTALPRITHCLPVMWKMRCSWRLWSMWFRRVVFEVPCGF